MLFTTPEIRWKAKYLLAGLLAAAGCMGTSRGAELYPEVAEYQSKEIKRVRFVGGEPYEADTLLTMVDTHESHCSTLGLPICIPFLDITYHKKFLNVEVVRRDVARLAAFYRREGYFGTRVEPRAEAAGGDTAAVAITFVIRRGGAVRLDSLAIEGADAVIPADSIASFLPIKVGDRFDLGDFDAAAEQLLRELQLRGYPYAEVLRNYSVDTLADRATASLDAIPRIRTQIDSIIVLGAENLGRTETLRQLTFRTGDVLRLSSFVQSQNNLYALPIVQLGSITIAPDSMQRTPADSTTTTVLVTVAEAPVNQAEVAVGYGNVECLRTDAFYTNRSFSGGARTLSMRASVSKIGLGHGTRVGLMRSICSAYGEESFENKLDYRANIDFTQPYLISPRNQLTATLYAERVSEPHIYQREARGGRLGVNHRISPRKFVSGFIETQRSSTVAPAAVFCSAFQVCLPADIERVTRPRFRNMMSASFVRDRTDNALDATRGSMFRAGAAWAAPWLGSTITFVRANTEGAYYRTIKPGYVVAASLRLGNYFRTATLDPAGAAEDFLPPEERFYAGGATTVRGFSPNALGRAVYVETNDTASAPAQFPLGGTSLGIVNVEMRMPSPVFPKQLRLAAFIDGGAVTTGTIWSMDARDWRFTPGFGFRATTPVGPARFDVAYNAYRPVRGPLFLAQDSTLTLVQDDYAPERPGFFRRFRVHVAVGQAF